MSTFPDVKKNFGFGCMRLPMDGEKVDYAEFTKMVDEFMAQGFNYFDTARVFIGGQGETAIRDCVVKRYPRDSFILTDKLSDSLFNSEDEIRPLFEKQLESCGVDYFDFYLMHALHRLHDEYRHAVLFGNFIAFSGLHTGTFPVEIVELDLAELHFFAILF